MTNNGWHRTKHRLKYLVLDGMNGLSVVSKFQKIYTMCNKKTGCLKYTVKPIVCSKKKVRFSLQSILSCFKGKYPY